MFRKLRSSKSAERDAARELVLKINRFSNEAYGVAQAFVTGGGASDALEGQAKELKAVLPELSALAASLPAEMQPDVKRALSEANLDINYVLAGGNLPCSIRLGRFREEMG